jgi:hypothetical protein
LCAGRDRGDGGVELCWISLAFSVKKKTKLKNKITVQYTAVFVDPWAFYIVVELLEILLFINK